MGGSMSKLFGSPSDNGGMDPATTQSIIGGLGTLAGARPSAQPGAQPQQKQQAQPVNFQTPNMPYIPPPQAMQNPYAQPGGPQLPPSPFYGG